MEYNGIKNRPGNTSRSKLLQVHVRTWVIKLVCVFLLLLVWNKMTRCCCIENGTSHYTRATGTNTNTDFTLETTQTTMHLQSTEREREIERVTRRSPEEGNGGVLVV